MRRKHSARRTTRKHHAKRASKRSARRSKTSKRRVISKSRLTALAVARARRTIRTAEDRGRSLAMDKAVRLFTNRVKRMGSKNLSTKQIAQTAAYLNELERKRKQLSASQARSLDSHVAAFARKLSGKR